MISQRPNLESHMPHQPTITVLYDGWCSVCSAGAQRLTKLDNNRGHLRMLDLRTHNELIDKHNLSPSEVRRVMHAITQDGQVLTAMDAVRATMRAVNRGWLVAWTKLPLVSWGCDHFYLWFANNRLRFFPIKKD
jgi:predicted DCC family thiol-disulfide oxidoreductase YuxK